MVGRTGDASPVFPAVATPLVRPVLEYANPWLQTSLTKEHKKLECGPMPNVMAALPNIGGAFCSTSQSLADA